jgi:hypothetical protein
VRATKLPLYRRVPFRPLVNGRASGGTLHMRNSSNHRRLRVRKSWPVDRRNRAVHGRMPQLLLSTGGASCLLNTKGAAKLEK